MNINFYQLNDMEPDIRAKIMARSQADIDDVNDEIRPIIEDVKRHGDAALIKYAKKYDGAQLTDLKVTEEEFSKARETIEPSIKEAINHCVQNVRKFHQEQMRRVEDTWLYEVEPGVWAGEQVNPIPSVGLYVPGGKNLFPSVMYMLCLPAVIAGVPEIAVITPPKADGEIGDALLYAADISGVQHIYKTAGAQGIAALAYGTQTIPAVSKVVGPGSPYAAAAKQLLSNIIDPGMPAGPSESIILCDETADPDNTILDLLNEAEHGPDSAALLITHDQKLAQYVLDHLPDAINALPAPQSQYCQDVLSNYGGIIVTENLESSIAFANDYAVEHLLLKVANPDSVLTQLKNAGEIIIGEESTISLANFGIGGNNVLPTNAKANTYSCTSVWDFLKRTSLVKTDKQGFDRLKDSVTRLCDYENFPAHGNSIRQRKI